MYVAKDAVAQLAGTLPQRAVVPCFVRGARLRVCVWVPVWERIRRVSLRPWLLNSFVCC